MHGSVLQIFVFLFFRSYCIGKCLCRYEPDCNTCSVRLLNVTFPMYTCRLLVEKDDNYIKWIDLSIVIVVMLTVALTAHAYLVRTSFKRRLFVSCGF